MNKIENIPDLTKLNSDIEAKTIELNNLLEKAENMLEKIKDNPIQSDEFNKVKKTGEENSNRLDKIQRDEKMLNLLLSNLPPGLQTIHGFGNFAYNKLNMELASGDILYLNKLSETESRSGSEINDE